MAALTTAVERLSTSEGLVVVLDLDATVWLPEVYTLRAPRGAADDWTPTLGTDVRVLPGAAAVLKLLAARPDTRVAVASRSARPEWSKALLAKVPDLAAAAVHIYPGDKRTHLRRIAKGLGCAFSRMVLFDDARDGKHGNCVGAAALGVLAVHCPQGLNEERWRAGLAAFERGVRGKVIDAPGGPSSKPAVTLPAVSLAMVLLRRPFILFALLRRHRAPRPRRVDGATRHAIDAMPHAAFRGAAAERLQDARDAEQRALRAVRGPARRRARRHEGLGQRVVEALAPRGRGRPPTRLPARRRGRSGGRRGDAAARVLRGRGAARLRLRRGLWGFRHGHIEREVVPEAVARARLPGRRRPRRAGGPRRRGGRGGHGEGGRSPGDRCRRGAREEDGEPPSQEWLEPELFETPQNGLYIAAILQALASLEFSLGESRKAYATASAAVWKSTTKSSHDAAVLVPSSDEEPASPRHRAGVASMEVDATIQHEGAVNF